MRLLSVAAVAALVAVSTQAGAATSIPIVNSSFELPDSGAAFVTNPVLGWVEFPAATDDLNGFALVGNPTHDPNPGVSAPDGKQVLFLGTTNTPAYVYQDVGAVTAGASYTLSAELGNWAQATTMGVWTMFLGTDNGGVFTAFGQLTGSSDVTPGSFALRSLTTAAPGDATGQLQVRLQGAGDGQAMWDDIRLTTDASTQPSGAPEPAAWALMLTGFAGLGAALRDRRRRAALEPRTT